MKTKKVPTIYDVRQLPAILTTSEAASCLRCHRDTVRGLCESGHIRAGKIGGVWRISKENLMAAYPELFGGPDNA